MPKKELGQHWLRDRFILEAIVDCADITTEDDVVEIGPGPGTLTSVLLGRARSVTAVEFDEDLARKLPGQFPGKNLTVINQDILSFDIDNYIEHRHEVLVDDGSAFSLRETDEPLQTVAGRSIAEEIRADASKHNGATNDAGRQVVRRAGRGYKVVANIPYYITAKIVHKFTTCTNMPQTIVLLVQKEVAERLAAESGDMSVLSVAAQIGYEVSLGPIVGAEWFTPPPKVDSQVVIMKKRTEPQVSLDEQKAFFRVVKAGFGERRKKLRSSLAGGLGLEKAAVDELLASAGIDPEGRAQELSIQQWKDLLKHV